MGILNPQQGEICRAIYVGRGSAATPSISFESRPNSGMFLQGDEEIAFTVAGVEVLVLGAAGLLFDDGTAAAPSVSFDADTDTGLYRIAADRLGFTTAGVAAMEISATGRIENIVGTTLLPSYTFTGDTNTGFSSATADTPIISAAGATVFTGSAMVITLGGAVDRTLSLVTEDARTTTVDTFAFQSTTTGAPAAGIGVGLNFLGDSGDESATSMGEIAFVYTDVTAASEDSVCDIFLRVAGVAAEPKYRFTSTAGTGFQLDFAHAVTADRVFTFPDLAGTAAVTSGSQSLLSTSASLGVGYATGAGGTVTQGVSKATAFTLSTITGLITMAGDILNADTTVNSAWTNTAIAATDLIVVQHESAGTLGAYNVVATPAAGSATFALRNITPANLTEAPVFRFAIIKSVSA